MRNLYNVAYRQSHIKLTLKKNVLWTVMILSSLVCSYGHAKQDLVFDEWIVSEAKIATGSNPKKWISYQYRIEADGSFQIKTEKPYRHGDRDALANLHAEGLCARYGTQLATLTRSKKTIFSGFRYPTLIDGTCASIDRFASIRLERQNAAASVANQEKRRKAQEEQRIIRRQQELLEERKLACSDFGFIPSTNAHATCVMELTIAAKAEADSNLHPCSARRTGQEHWSSRQSADCFIQQARAERLANESNDVSKRRDSARALIQLGAAIASGGKTSDKAMETTPLSSGRYKTCSYRVAGEIVSMTVGRAELCPATRSMGGQTGYLVR